MACDKFETDGLLYCAGELSVEQSSAYETHLLNCDDCAVEVTAYNEMFGGVSASELLTEVPSAECDQKIYAALESEAVRQSKPVVSFGGMFTLFVQRIAVPAAIFVMALAIGFQISQNSVTKTETIAKSEDSSTVKKDSINDTARTFIQGGATGVIPVTLEEK